MKTVIVLIGVLFASHAYAGASCTTYGTQTICTDSNGDTASCITYGTQTICN